MHMAAGSITPIPAATTSASPSAVTGAGSAAPRAAGKSVDAAGKSVDAAGRSVDASGRDASTAIDSANQTSTNGSWATLNPSKPHPGPDDWRALERRASSLRLR